MPEKPQITLLEYFHRLQKRYGLNVQDTAKKLGEEIGCSGALIINLIYGWRKVSAPIALALEKHSRRQLDLHYLLTLPVTKKVGERKKQKEMEERRRKKAEVANLLKEKKGAVEAAASALQEARGELKSVQDFIKS